MGESAEHVTQILDAASAGDAQAAERLFPLVYDELRRLAAARMANEPPGQTLQPTALVHEAWLRMGGDHQQAWKNRAHFFGAAAEAMRRILIDRARKRKARQASGLAEPEELHESRIALRTSEAELLGLDEVLQPRANFIVVPGHGQTKSAWLDVSENNPDSSGNAKLEKSWS